MPLEVVGRLVIEMASFTIGGSNSLMVEGSTGPGSGVMTPGTLPIIVIGGLILLVAGLAITGIHQGVIKIDADP